MVQHYQWEVDESLDKTRHSACFVVVASQPLLPRHDGRLLVTPWHNRPSIQVALLEEQPRWKVEKAWVEGELVVVVVVEYSQRLGEVEYAIVRSWLGACSFHCRC